MGLRSHVRGPLRVDQAALIDRKVLRFMGDAAAFNYIAMREAIADAQLPETMVSNPRAGLITGTGGGSVVSTPACNSTASCAGESSVSASEPSSNCRTVSTDPHSIPTCGGSAPAARIMPSQ